MKRIRKELDAIAASVLLLLSVASVAYGYRHAFPADPDTERALLDQIFLGKRSYAIVQAGRCVGSVQTSLSEGKLFEFRAVLSLNLEAQTSAANEMPGAGNTPSPTIVLNAFFNPLGQLIRSSSQVRFQPFKVELQTRDVNPVTVLLATELNGLRQEKSYLLPGPIMLERKLENGTEGDEFRITYFHLQNLQLPALESTLSPLAARAGLSIEPTNDGCDGMEAAALDLQFLGKELAPIFNRFLKLPVGKDGFSDL